MGAFCSFTISCAFFSCMYMLWLYDTTICSWAFGFENILLLGHLCPWTFVLSTVGSIFLFFRKLQICHFFIYLFFLPLNTWLHFCHVFVGKNFKHGREDELPTFLDKCLPGMSTILIESLNNGKTDVRLVKVLLHIFYFVKLSSFHSLLCCFQLIHKFFFCCRVWRMRLLVKLFSS